MDLDDQLKWLDQTLLSRVTTPFPAPLPPDEKAALAAYLVLAHACIEEYLEECFLRRVESIIQLAETESLVPSAVANFGLNAAMSLPKEKQAGYKTRTLRGALKAANAHYKAAVKANHGIKQHNLEKLAEGAGVDWKAFESELAVAIADLTTLGAKRGEVGHLSPFTDKSTLVTTRVDVADAASWVNSAAKAAQMIELYLDEELQARYLD